METFLRCFLHACPLKWSSWLSLAEFWYNTGTHSALGRSPFEVLYGYAPRHFGIDPASAVLVLIYQLGSGSVRSCRILCANISCVLRTE
jgi:hypothetical protein